ncbi:MAG TPA: DotU family type IV/VI secretion system protein [Candidatus Angelobacter sp.]|nr:DotU family type IV/VI secretion system protein [Candidatus Angelobacter sp.]
MAGIQTQIPERRANVSIALQELFTAIVRLRFNRQTVPSADAFKVQVREGLRAAIQEAISRGYAPEDVKIAAFAVVAFLDESILNSRNPVFAKWSGQSLQEELSGKHLAGEEFFEYVQRLLDRRDSPEVADLLEVFHLCLLLGYRGRYGLGGGGELHGMMAAIQDKITRIRGGGGPLSPYAMLPLDPPLPSTVDPWFRRLAIAAISSAVLGIVIFALCKFLLAGGISDLHSLVGHS